MKKYIKEEKFKFISSVILMLVISIGTIYSIYIRSNITDLILKKNYYVYRYIIILLVLIVLIEKLNTLLRLNNVSLIKKWKLKLGNNISENIMKMGYDKYKEKSVGTYISWYTGELPLVSSYIFENSVAIINHITLSLVSLLIMFYINIYIGILAVILLLMLYLIGGIFGRKISEAYQGYAKINSKFNNILQDFLLGYDLLKNYNNLTFLKKNINYGQNELENQHYKIKNYQHMVI
ncbi:ABC transporter ATP-binding protein [Streptobacillus moniliformis]|uniref:ABC transporter ATP-binding protein n=1 Tax=Streptobacillus moniliformis TaxID=34105 RepID=UPI0018C867E9|nr:ABC transporter ATP-binding protein [Streptobacillus moniliformis]